jgi:hypothetical protein
MKFRFVPKPLHSDDSGAIELATCAIALLTDKPNDKALERIFSEADIDLRRRKNVSLAGFIKELTATIKSSVYLERNGVIVQFIRGLQGMEIHDDAVSQQTMTDNYRLTLGLEAVGSQERQFITPEVRTSIRELVKEVCSKVKALAPVPNNNLNSQDVLALFLTYSIAFSDIIFADVRAENPENRADLRALGSGCVTANALVQLIVFETLKAKGLALEVCLQTIKTAAESVSKCNLSGGTTISSLATLERLKDFKQRTVLQFGILSKLLETTNFFHSVDKRNNLADFVTNNCKSAASSTDFCQPPVQAIYYGTEIKHDGKQINVLCNWYPSYWTFTVEVPGSGRLSWSINKTGALGLVAGAEYIPMDDLDFLNCGEFEFVKNTLLKLGITTTESLRKILDKLPYLYSIEDADLIPIGINDKGGGRIELSCRSKDALAVLRAFDEDYTSDTSSQTNLTIIEIDLNKEEDRNIPTSEIAESQPIEEQALKRPSGTKQKWSYSKVLGELAKHGVSVNTGQGKGSHYKLHCETTKKSFPVSARMRNDVPWNKTSVRNCCKALGLNDLTEGILAQLSSQ